MLDAELTIQAAETVALILRRHSLPAVVIGATALAAYHYARQTEDIDLGVNADLTAMRTLVPEFEKWAGRLSCANPTTMILSVASLI